jgi:hypothetical protein
MSFLTDIINEIKNADTDYIRELFYEIRMFFQTIKGSLARRRLMNSYRKAFK